MLPIDEKLLKELEQLRGEPIETIDPESIPCEEVSDPERLCKDPLVSVAMITYNHEPYIREAIEGVVNQQTDFPFELIIGEDCSIDNTRQICVEYQKKYPHIIRVLFSEKNVGATANFLRVFKCCRGKYFSLCEGDDYWHSNKKLSKQTVFLVNNPTFSVVYSDFNQKKYEVNQYSTLTTKKLLKSNSEMCLKSEILELWLFWATCTCVGKTEIIRNAIKNNPWFSAKLYLNDVIIRLELAKNGHIGFISESLGTYRIHAGGVTQDSNRRRNLALIVDDTIIRYWYALHNYGNDLADSVIKNRFPLFFRYTLILLTYKNYKFLISCVKKYKIELNFIEKISLWGLKSKFCHFIVFISFFIAKKLRVIFKLF